MGRVCGFQASPQVCESHWQATHVVPSLGIMAATVGIVLTFVGLIALLRCLCYDRRKRTASQALAQRRLRTEHEWTISQTPRAQLEFGGEEDLPPYSSEPKLPSFVERADLIAHDGAGEQFREGDEPVPSSQKEPSAVVAAPMIQYPPPSYHL